MLFVLYVSVMMINIVIEVFEQFRVPPTPHLIA